MVVRIILQAALWIWFLGCTFTYRIGKRVLVEGMGFKSVEFRMLCVYTLALILFYACRPVGKGLLFAVLLLWIAVQFRCHWYYTIFGASEQKLKGYYSAFRDTVRIFPASDTRLVPDLYHIVLHILIVLNIVWVFL